LEVSLQLVQGNFDREQWVSIPDALAQSPFREPGIFNKVGLR
jgi:hypothetical protein